MTFQHASTRLLIAVTASLALACAGAPAEPPGPTPGAPGLAVFYGAVKVDGAAPFEGMTLTVQVNGVNCGSGLVRGGRYEVVVASDADKGGCGKPGDPVLFLIGGEGDPGGHAFDQKGAFQMASQKLDLTAKTQ